MDREYRTRLWWRLCLTFVLRNHIFLLKWALPSAFSHQREKPQRFNSFKMFHQSLSLAVGFESRLMSLPVLVCGYPPYLDPLFVTVSELLNVTFQMWVLLKFPYACMLSVHKTHSDLTPWLSRRTTTQKLAQQMLRKRLIIAAKTTWCLWENWTEKNTDSGILCRHRGEMRLSDL